MICHCSKQMKIMQCINSVERTKKCLPKKCNSNTLGIPTVIEFRFLTYANQSQIEPRQAKQRMQTNK